MIDVTARKLAEQLTVERAVESLRRLGRITSLEEVDQGGPGPVLDLGRSTRGD